MAFSFDFTVAIVHLATVGSGMRSAFIVSAGDTIPPS